MCCVSEDARSKLSRMIYDPAVTKKDFEHYLTTVMPLWLGHFEKLAPPLVTQVILIISLTCILDNCIKLVDCIKLREKQFLPLSCKLC